MSAAPDDRPKVLLLSADDNVLVALMDLETGQRVGDGVREIAMLEPVRLGHKIARVALAPGSKVIKYGACIGAATGAVPAGAWVHTHNLASNYLATPGAER